ncbi:MAG: hypothetical protein Kow0099_28540 [Candidatus Abyssubacteria bacterium]
MCRILCSSVRCSQTGYAQMPPQLLSFSTVCQQLVEHLDRRGCSGYLIHVVPLFSDQGLHEAYRRLRPFPEHAPSRPNRPNPGLLVPPEHQSQIQVWLQRLLELLEHS